MLRRNFQTAVIPALVALGLLPAPGPAQGTVFPVPAWSTATPEAAGLDPAKLDQLAALAGGTGMVVRGGHVVREWGSPDSGGDWASASKSVLSTLLFMADQQQLCGIHQVIGDFQPGGSVKDSSITFFHLANMISGYSRGESPGQAWAYNDHAINLYGYVLCHRVFGTSPPDVFDQQLGFLGFQDPVTVSASQYGRIKVMSVRDFARLGLLWLNRGHWDGTQVIDESYFDLLADPVPLGTPLSTVDGPESWNLGTFGGSDNQGFDGTGGYAMSFWTNSSGIRWPGFPEEVYLSSGHGDIKVCWVLPDLDIVAAAFDVDPAFGGSPGLQILYDAVVGATPAPEGIESSSWSAVKARHR